ncbi:MAG: urease subunit gamma [Planctomycetes bacterium]|nr:urease subunit gamma [Planctomycetota bacterium]
MHLSPRELDKLMLHQVGCLAQKRLARGVRLNHPEAVALIATVVLEFIRDGNQSVADLMALGQKLIGRRQVMPGVPEMVAEVQVEGTFPDGTKLVTVHHPIAAEHGDLSLALYGSFLPVPSIDRFPALPEEPEPGAVTVAAGEITINANRPTLSLSVTNLADRPIQVGSHYHFIETNPYLRFDRAKSYGKRLDIIAGTAVRFEPGETKTVQLVDIAGSNVIRGGNNLADGPVSDAGLKIAMERVQKQGFAHEVQS